MAERISVALSSCRQISGQITKFDEVSGTPIISPLKTLEEALTWESGLDELCVATVPLRRTAGVPSSMDDPSTQKMIVCHDMMGGYVKDKFPQGTGVLEDYYFYNWQNIGAFIYFSHHFITIPPPTWTNAAHRHGVLSMGTLITEWEQGGRLCHELLQNEIKVMELSQQLVNIAKYYGFDGWLINIENPIHPTLLDQVYMLLTLVTTGMHCACPGSKVIWYDSVTTEGQLRWQNMLNDKNRPYFDLCDGIFLNYNWSGAGLAASRSRADERRGEVYVGIDVFGRGCPGGGGFNSCEALEAIHKSGLSSALFAPGWVYENCNKDNFFTNQNKFWSLLQPWLPVTSTSVLPLVTSFGRGCGKLLAIDGETVYHEDWNCHSAQDHQPSYCIESSILNDTQSGVVLETASLDLTTAYNNGASLKLEGRVRDVGQQASTKPSILRLFKTNMNFSKPLVISYTFKLTSDPSLMSHGCRYFLQLHTNGSPSRVFLDPFSIVQGSGEEDQTSGLPLSSPVPRLPGCILAPIPPTASSRLHQKFTGNSEDGSKEWKTCYFVLHRPELQELLMQEISIGFYALGKPPTTSASPRQTPFSLHIGEVKVIQAALFSPTCRPHTLTSIQCSDVQFSLDDLSQVSFTLSWLTFDNDLDPIEHVNIYSSLVVSDSRGRGETGDSNSSSNSTRAKEENRRPPLVTTYKFWGRSFCNCYRVANFCLLQSGVDQKKQSSTSRSEGGSGQTVRYVFRLQPVTVTRSKPSLKDCPHVVVTF